MTTIICYKDETVSMILADRRLNWGKNQEGGYDDTREKIVATLFGWASGGGFSDFSDIFISKLIRDKVLQLPELKVAFKSTVEQCIHENPDYIDDIKRSTVIASWLERHGENIVPYVGVLAMEYGNKIRALFNNKIDVVVFPPEFLNDPKKREELSIKHELESEQRLTNPQAVLKKMLEIFKDISSESKYVSDICDVGIIEIKEGKPQKFKASGEVTQLLKDLESDKLIIESVH
nr:hypothetical protein P5629_08515 [Bacillus subtilis]